MKNSVKERLLMADWNPLGTTEDFDVLDHILTLLNDYQTGVEDIPASQLLNHIHANLQRYFDEQYGD